MGKMRSPLEPMSTTVKSVVTVMAAVMGAGLLGLLFADNVSVLGVGDASVCATDTTATTGAGGSGPHPGFTPAPKASLLLDTHPTYCTEAADGLQNLLDTTSQLVPLLFTAGALVLVLRLMKGAERDGLYTAQTAGRLRGLGWWLLAGSVVSAIVTSVVERALVASLSVDSGSHAWSGLFLWDVPFMAILTGLGILSFARVMRVGIAMREDLEGTV
ncbi:DUF2975 domain-containing protein [Streptomyces sp. BA2]|uniref:DUF2975 domain-containing protein n=1 Tax=Streptomyces sp. BA2 TaxID=436595 RepID=UPI0013229520|nr:DUF2975 domain-containing protein [Streptomyces sp. BA2]MWA08078.1 DUF2975 domain-containing protein [Streptomyces sp. BA2]